MIIINFPSDGTSKVFAYKNDNVIFHVDRKFYFGSKIKGKFYENEKLLAETTDFFLKIKIISQDLESKITVVNNNLLFTNFMIDNDKLKIIQNPLYFLYPKFYSKMYWNGNLVATISMIKLFNFEGVSLKVIFNSEDSRIEYYSTILYLMTCLTTNL